MPLHTAEEIRNAEIMENLLWTNEAVRNVTPENLIEVGCYLRVAQKTLAERNFLLGSSIFSAYILAAREFDFGTGDQKNERLAYLRHRPRRLRSGRCLRLTPQEAVLPPGR